MLKRLFKQFKYGKKGFTLIELLVVVAILGVLAAVAIPNVAKFINSGKTEANNTELANVQTAVTAMMADASAGTIAGGSVGPSITEITATGSKGTKTIGSYLQGGVAKLSRTYYVATDGSVTAP